MIGRNRFGRAIAVLAAISARDRLWSGVDSVPAGMP